MKLIFFSTSFPYGAYQRWKMDELDSLSRYFDQIEIIPHEHAGDKKLVRKKGVIVKHPLITSPVIFKPKKLFRLFSRRFFTYLSEFVFRGVFLSKKKMEAFFSDAYKIEIMMASPSIRMLLSDKNKHLTVLYFYWGVKSAFLALFLNGFRRKVVRFHGYDLYEERNYGYIPFRKALLKCIDAPVLISEHGKKYLETKYPFIKGKTVLHRLGTKFEGLAVSSTDDVFRIMSCSSMVELKRVSLLAKAVCMLKMTAEWTHLGDGLQMEDVLLVIKNAPSNIKVFLPGKVEPEKVKSYYVNKQVDVFINVSTTEGVPVSVMEALSASIPVIATAVGGTPEIVDEKVGKLLDVNLSETQISKALSEYYYLSTAQKQILRENAYARFRERSDADLLNEHFAKFLYEEKWPKENE